MKKYIIKFTKDDIKSVYLNHHQWDMWLNITLKSGSEIKSHSDELKNLLLNKSQKSFTAICTHKHYWLSTND